MSPTLLSADPPLAQWKLQGLYGAPALLFSECSSTHRYMHETYARLAPGTLVVADAQTAGRGRHDRVWRAPPGKNLSFSLLVPLEGLPPERWAQVTQVAAITLASLLRSLGVEAAVKWPNDLLWHRHKMCGIISELLGQGDHRLLSLGIGLNVNTEAEDFAGLDRLASSLRLVLGHPLNRAELLRLFIERLEQSLSKFRSEGFAPWIDEWRAMDCFLGTRGRVVGNDGSLLEGIIRDINQDGSLLFLTDKGEERVIWSGDLEI